MKNFPEKSNGQLIGPHAGIELELMLKGLKPAAILDQKQFNKFLPFIGNFKFNWITLDWGYKLFFVSLPEENKRISILKQIYSKKLSKNDHIKIGQLLGYSQKQINYFLENSKKLK